MIILLLINIIWLVIITSLVMKIKSHLLYVEIINAGKYKWLDDRLWIIEKDRG